MKKLTAVEVRRSLEKDARAAGVGPVPAALYDPSHTAPLVILNADDVSDIADRLRSMPTDEGSDHGLLSQIRREHHAKLRGVPDGSTGHPIAARLSRLEELVDIVMELDPDASKAEALRIASVGREAMLDTLGELIADAEDG